MSAYRELRRIETFMRLTVEDRGSILPEGEKLELLSKVFGESGSSEFTALVHSLMNETRQSFIHLSHTYLF